MEKVAGILFFVSWLLCGCGVETMLDHRDGAQWKGV